MPRVIAFDQQTANNLVARTRTPAQLGDGDPLKAALASECATLLMPASAQGSGDVLIVSVRRPPKQGYSAVSESDYAHVQTAPETTARVPQADEVEPVAYEATGFLGLEDSPVYADDLAPKPPKKWWQKLLDETH